MRDITGNSRRDREINEEIERTSIRVSQSRTSVGRTSRTSIGSRNSYTGHSTRNAQSLNRIGTQSTSISSRINLEDELKMHREFRQKQMSNHNHQQQKHQRSNLAPQKKSFDECNSRPSVIRERTVEDTRESKLL